MGKDVQTYMLVSTHNNDSNNHNNNHKTFKRLAIFQHTEEIENNLREQNNLGFSLTVKHIIYV